MLNCQEIAKETTRRIRHIDAMQLIMDEAESEVLEAGTKVSIHFNNMKQAELAYVKDPNDVTTIALKCSKNEYIISVTAYSNSIDTLTKSIDAFTAAVDDLRNINNYNEFCRERATFGKTIHRSCSYYGQYSF